MKFENLKNQVPSEENYYDILGVKQDATQEEIRMAWVALAEKSTHNDTMPISGIEVVNFEKIFKAYARLSDPEKRSSYDSYISENGSSQKNKFKGSRNTEPITLDINDWLNYISHLVEEKPEQAREVRDIILEWLRWHQDSDSKEIEKFTILLATLNNKLNKGI
jgi:molecular chaperone DnaJ